jgi:hypothetical protein
MLVLSELISSAFVTTVLHTVRLMSIEETVVRFDNECDREQHCRGLKVYVQMGIK